VQCQKKAARAKEKADEQLAMEQVETKSSESHENAGATFRIPALMTSLFTY
jgi:hypothetical protein